MPRARLALTRPQILAYRRRMSALDARLPLETAALRRAAWAGLQDSMPRAALLSLHARVEGADPALWEHASLVQLWGPRYHNYVVAAQDLAVFSLGRLPDDAGRRARAQDIADRLHAWLDGRRMPFGQAARAIGLADANAMRYAATTGRVRMRWDGARQPTVWTAPAPEQEPPRAREELARRYLQVFGPTTAASFAGWAGITPAEAAAAWTALAAELAPVRTQAGEAWILAADEAALRAPAGPAATARLLPSGDVHYLCWDADRELLLPDAGQRAALWTTRVWPGALLVQGELAGIWRRAAATVAVTAWRALSAAEREAVEAEAAALPLPGLRRAVVVRWD